MGKVVTLGEVMLRLSTESGNRLAQSENLKVNYGGAEANVAISLANYGHEVLFASKVPKTVLGEAVQKHLQRYRVNTEFLITGGTRLGTYYLEAGSGERGSAVIYDRKGSSFAELEELEWNLTDLFNDAELFHISGITPALSEKWQSLALKLIQQAKKAGCKISFDVNYRGKLWSQAAAGKALEQILPEVDYCSAGVLDAIHLLGITETAAEAENETAFYYQRMKERFPNIQVFYSTKRVVHSASVNDLMGTLWMDDHYYESSVHRIAPIVDRVGAGDAFSGGVLHGLLKKMHPQELIDFATAAAALKHTVFGDCNQFTEEEVQQFLAADSGKINR